MTAMIVAAVASIPILIASTWLADKRRTHLLGHTLCRDSIDMLNAVMGLDGDRGYRH